jgi:hypothetical protein
VVVELGRAVAHALAREDEVRRVGHALHAAGDDDVGALGPQHVVREHHRAHSRSAHLRECHRARRLRQAGAERGLARRCLALPGHQAVAHQHLVDGVAGNAGALDRRLDRDAAELVRGERAEVAEHAADRRARGGDDDDGFGHGNLLVESQAAHAGAVRCRRASKRFCAS